MNISNKILIFSSYLVFGLIQGEINYEISVPEIICDRNDISNGKPGTTTIGLVGDGKFNFKLNFQRINDPCRNVQRCNLIVWKVIRDFERYLNNYSYTQTNSIEFNNSMLIPGLKYIINIFISQGKKREQKQFSIDFVDSSKIDSTAKPRVSLSLIGPPSIEAHMPYVLNAKINTCSNVSDYYLEWKLLDDTHNILEMLHDRGLELIIPSFTFQGGRQYFVKCSLVKIENEEVITTSLKTVKIKTNVKKLIVKLPALHTTMNIKQPIIVKPYIVDLGNTGEEMKMQWFCMYNNKNVCLNSHGDILNIDEGFSEQGEYNISIRVSKGSVVKQDCSIIKVIKNSPSIEIDTIQSPILPSSGVEIGANVNDLRTFCTLQWKAEEGPYFLDLNDVPGNMNELFKVIVRRDLFLKELEEYSHDVTNKEHDLLIPPPTGMWPGLPHKDSDYKLRFILEVKCPNIQLQDNNVEIEYSEDILKNKTLATALVEIDVDVPPKPQSLNVVPLAGVALETVFSFQTSEAMATGTDRPFLYKFGYILGDREFIFCNVLDYMKCESALPYMDEGVQTILEVCDSFGSCGKIFGPTVNTTLPDQINEKNVLGLFIEKMNTEDFYKAFGYALTVLYTTTTLEDTEIYKQYFSREVYNKIQFLLKYYNDEASWAKRTNKLIKYISDFNEDLSFSDTVLHALDELRGRLLSAQKENLTVHRRRLLTVNLRSVELDNFKSYLAVSDLIITSSKNEYEIQSEKEHLNTKIKQYLGTICMNLYESKKKILLEFKSVILVVQELSKTSYDNVQVIPYNGNSWNTTAEIKFNAEDMTKFKDENLCIAKILYKNFFGKIGVTYEVALLNANDGKAVEDNIRTFVFMPYSGTESAEKIPKCMVYTNGWQERCTFVKMLMDFAQCSCPVMGTYYLEHDDEPTSGTTTIQNLETNVPFTKSQVEAFSKLEEFTSGSSEESTINQEGPINTSFIIESTNTDNSLTNTFTSTIQDKNAYTDDINQTNYDFNDIETSPFTLLHASLAKTTKEVDPTIVSTTTENKATSNADSDSYTSYNPENPDAKTSLLLEVITSKSHPLTTNSVSETTTEVPTSTFMNNTPLDESFVFPNTKIENITANPVNDNTSIYSSTSTDPDISSNTTILSDKADEEDKTEKITSTSTEPFVSSLTPSTPLSTVAKKNWPNDTNIGSFSVTDGVKPSVLHVNGYISINFSVNATFV